MSSKALNGTSRISLVLLGIKRECFLHYKLYTGYPQIMYYHNSTSGKMHFLKLFFIINLIKFIAKVSSCLICDIPHTMQNLKDWQASVIKLQQCAE